ncbi:hypothetical protein SAMN05444159_1264 [Bradyrhizobium lablabi]|uniref:GIY-YIG domain-containing protein n=1 Tax=Bradyrhizobium lablabi TaxID=722472 RepID=A0A1M6LFR7_9BRAD|nr:GIY-YIG nuclease family protein [Bradyrhizobium lablabi]SHJ70073.1 hypothetical protein SAMN05444159_1264 [Bradyrhizobium lablabi]
MNADEALAQIRASGKRFYVYVLKKPNGTPFYVGIGTGRRLLDHKYYAKKDHLKSHKLSIIRKILSSGNDLTFDVECHSDERSTVEARERELISRIGRADLNQGPLANNTDGGEGAHNPSPEELLRRSAVLKARWVGRDRSILAHLWTPEMKAKATAAKKGVKRKFAVRGSAWMTAEMRAARSDRLRADPVSKRPGVGAKISASKLGKKMPDHWMKDPIKKLAFARAKHPRARAIEVEGRRFECIEDAADAFGKKRNCVDMWLKRGNRGAKYL